MGQLDLFPRQRAPLPAPLSARPNQGGLDACPRCGRSVDDPTFGCWVVTLGGPHRGMRCDPCWEAEA